MSIKVRSDVLPFRYDPTKVSIETIKARQWAYMKIVEKNGYEEIVVRPVIGGHEFKQRRFKASQLSEAVAYINNCFEKASKTYNGMGKSNGVVIKTFGFYADDYLNKKLRDNPNSKATVSSYRQWLYRLGNCPTGNNPYKDTNRRKIKVKKLKWLHDEYISKARQAKTHKVLALKKQYERFCRENDFEADESLTNWNEIYQRLRLHLIELIEKDIRNYHAHTLKNEPIDQITTEVIEEKFREYFDPKRLRIKHQIVIVLGELKKHLIKHHKEIGDLIDWDMDDLKRYKPKATGEIEFYSEKELEKLYQHFDEVKRDGKYSTHDRLCYAGLLLLTQTGLRAGELLALNKADVIDLSGNARNSFKVSKTISQIEEVIKNPEMKTDGYIVRREYISENTKSETVRKIDLGQFGKELIEYIVSLHASYSEKIDGRNRNLLFPSVSKNALNGWISYRAFVKTAKIIVENGAKVEWRRSHEGGRKTFTNTFLDNADKCGADINKALTTVQKALGHKNITTTLQSYAKAKQLPDADKIAFIDMIGKPKKPA